MVGELSIDPQDYGTLETVCKDNNFRIEIIDGSRRDTMRVAVEVLFASQMYYLGTLHQIEKRIYDRNLKSI